MKTRGIPLSSLPPRLQAQVVAQMATKSPQSTPEAKRLRQSSKGPNKTELAFAAYLRALYPGAKVYEQAVTLVLANGLRFTPDMFIPVIPGHAAGPTFWETKGYMRDDAAAKIKMAARVHPWAAFYLVTKQGRTGTGWSIEAVLP